MKVKIKILTLALFLLFSTSLFSTIAFAETVDLIWDAYSDPAAIDGFAVERSIDLVNWTQLNAVLLPATDTTYTDIITSAGTYFWRIVATDGPTRSRTLKGVWKIIEVISPTGVRTP